MGMRFIKGKSRKIMAETTANAAFRAQYLRKKVLNLNRRNFQCAPSVVEVHAAEVWQSSLKRKNDDDYHGNFNTEQFEKWFTNLSAILASKYGPCNIHVDGASYHKRQTNPTPNSSSLKRDMQEWLEDNGLYNVFFVDFVFKLTLYFVI
ncbi:uncharacterized protein PITG_06436 [Phytophthora infestans T30-4]|uniref:Uncharacterized protein n=1 Tax=Phytophthora infestans (strain T30-4) TaxID=403677 RepID=D0N4V3_PHYIT|nr:uncharacterized protein PITG_06436 [Phytophthora infestans T30-4]EEY69911.1 conserved hypothetical protein [Phytophthora infestans T30-4]|eukprot:XP_002998558.1 conserved hypothetical protein [Phytophthora infestans T30-4]